MTTDCPSFIYYLILDHLHLFVSMSGCENLASSYPDAETMPARQPPYLDISVTYLLSSFSRLYIFSSNKLGKEGGQALASALSCLTALTSLDVR